MNTILRFAFILGALSLATACFRHDTGGATELWQCPMHPQVTSDKKSTCPICQMDLVRVEKKAAPAAKDLWQCPMHPQVSSDKKSSCPICQMDLVKVEKKALASGAAAGVEGHAVVTVDARRRQLIGVRSEPVARRSLTRTLRSFGTITHDTELYGAQQEYLSAWQYLQEAKKSGLSTGPTEGLLSAARKKLIIAGYSEVQLAALERAGESDESLIIGRGARAWIYAQIYEIDLPYVHPGQAVRFVVPSRPGQAFAGTIQSMDTRVNPETRSVTARILAQYSGATLIHDAYVQVLISVPLGEMLAIPESAILDSGLRVLAFVAGPDGTFEPRELMLGRHGDGYFEVLRGVKESERVVVRANFLIDSESQLQAAIENMDGRERSARRDGAAGGSNGAATGGHRHD
jgi:multidrug efflux pump subunit AcrA (membrane-fusion protein)